MILLFDTNETTYLSNGLGALSEADSCIVTENRNGEYDLKMTYPVSGHMFHELQTNRIIFCKPNPFSEPQPFRIYRISTPLKQEVAVYANHISYDLSGIPVSPFTAGSAIEAMQKMEDHAAVESPFEFYTNKTTNADMSVSVPSSSRALLGGQTGSILDVYGGEYEFDRFTVKLLNKRGSNNGVSLRYGKNITDVSQEFNISQVYTGIYPYWKSQESYVELPEKIIKAKGTFPKEKILAVDFTQKILEQPTVTQLREVAEQYIVSNKVGIPTVNITVSFVALDQTEEYKDIAILEKIMLCDDVNIEFPALGISATSECVTTEYDVLLDRYNSITLGEATTTIADTISGNTEDIKDKPSYSFLDKAVNNATNWITNGAGYMVAVKDEAGNWKEICSLDTPDIETAINVWRWNNGGFGHSSKGYNGPYETAITQDGQIVANFITAGEMNAGVIKAGLLKGHKGNAYFNLDTGQLAADKLIDPNNSNRFLRISKGSDGSYGLAYIDPVSQNPVFRAVGMDVNGDIQTGIYFQDTAYFLVKGKNDVVSRQAITLSNEEKQVRIYSTFVLQADNIKTSIIRSKFNDNTFVSVGNGIVAVNGSFTVTGGGSKNRAVETESYGTVLLNAYETADCYFGDIGNGITDNNGTCRIDLDPVFLETVNTEVEYVVFLQKNGPGDLWVENKEQTYFTVSGTPGLTFSYEIKAKQKGYEHTRLEVFKDGAKS
jgi:phage minor structural protein